VKTFDTHEITVGVIRDHLKNIHDLTIRKFMLLRDTGDFTRKTIEVLLFIRKESTAPLHPYFHPFTETVIESLNTLSSSMASDLVFSEPTGYFNLIRKYLSTCYTPFEGVPLKGMQVLGGLETRNLQFKRVVILDMNEEVLPPNTKDATLIPLKAREALGIPTYADREQITEYYLNTLINGAKEVYLFSVENSKKERSRYIERLLWENEKSQLDREGATKGTGKGGLVETIQYAIDLRNKEPGEIKKTDEIIYFLKNYTYSATSLDTYLNCPLKFYYKYVLKLREQEEITGNIERKDIGKFIHRVLHVYFLKRKGKILREKDLGTESMERVIAKLFKEEYGKGPTGATYLFLGQVKKQMKEFLVNYQIPAVQRVETRIHDLECDITIPFHSVKLTGRLDRIEERGKEWFVLDYKISAKKTFVEIRFDRIEIDQRDSWNEAVGSLQLPFYVLLLCEGLGKAVTECNGAYLLLGQSMLSSRSEYSLFDDSQDREKNFEILKTIIIGLLEEIRDPAILFWPTLNRKKICRFCEYVSFCGV